MAIQAANDVLRKYKVDPFVNLPPDVIATSASDKFSSINFIYKNGGWIVNTRTTDPMISTSNDFKAIMEDGVVMAKGAEFAKDAVAVQGEKFGQEEFKDIIGNFQEKE